MDASDKDLELMSEADVRGAMRNQRASIRMQQNAENADKVMSCWWTAESPKAIFETMDDMAQLFENDIRETPNVYDFTD